MTTNNQDTRQILTVLPGVERWFNSITYDESPIYLQIYGIAPWSCKTVWFRDTSTQNGTIPNIATYNIIREAVKKLRGNPNILYWLQPKDDTAFTYPVYDTISDSTITFKVIQVNEMKKLLAFVRSGRHFERITDF